MITVDGRTIAPPADGARSVLHVCRAAGAEIPAFCARDGLAPAGHCRACLVEVDGALVPACTTPARDGAVVRTRTPRLDGYRRALGALMLGEAAPQGAVGAALAAWGAEAEAARRPPAPPGSIDRTHPYLRIDLEKCILCRNCVRTCEEVQGCFVLAVTGRGASSRITWGPGAFADSACVACGACVAACPTGALTDVDREREAAERRARPEAPARTVRTTCGYCGVGCQLEAHAIGNDLVRIDGVADAAVNRGHLCVKGRYAHGWVRHPDRLTTPLVRRDGVLAPATWDAALARVAAELARLRGAVAGLASARCTNEENYLFQKWLRGGLGTNDVDCCARVCHAPSAHGMRAAFGTGAATGSLDDLERADLILVVGANPTEAHPVTGARIVQAALRGAKLVVIDPRRTALAELADVHLRVRPGANVPLLNALASVLVEEGYAARAFIASRTEGWEAYAAFVREHTPERWAEVTGVPAAEVRRAARLFGLVARPLIVHGLGVTEHRQGSDAVELICNLALLRGAVGRPGAGVNPLRGQNNVQGAADMGCQPDLLPGYVPVSDAAARARFAAAWGRFVPSTPGRPLHEILAAIREGAIRALIVQGEDLVQTDPNRDHVRETLRRLELLVVLETFPTETTKLAHVVLPAAGVFEKDGTFTNGERRVQRVRRVVDPPGEARADLHIVADLMAATGWPQPHARADAVLDEIASLVPAFAGVSFAALEGDGLQWPVPAPGHPGTPILHADGFARGRARFHRVDFVPSPSFAPGVSARPLALVTGRVLAHYNGGSMTRRGGNLALEDADRLEIHPRDAAPRGVAEGDGVRVRSAHGEARARARVTTRVPPGTVFLSFHFPETAANAVTGDVRDAATGCPEYKLTPVEVERG
jgi:formate dehydrogenase major subunit